MRTEMVIRMTEKGHAAKAMKVAAAMDGVESVTVAGKDKSLLRVVGDGVDCNHLTTRLRRKVGHADVVELRTLHAGYGSSSSSRAGSSYGYGYGGSINYGSGSYPAATAGGYAPAEYYGSQQPASYSYGGYYAAPAYAAGGSAGVQHEYYPTSADPNGCSIM